MFFNIKHYKNIKLMLTCALSISILNGCASNAQNDKLASQVITALAQEVQGCRFIGDVSVAPRYTIEAARYDLKIRAAKIGATHLVETIAVPQRMSSLTYDSGIAMSGRAYICPQGYGPQVNNVNAQQKLQGDIPHPQVNSDDTFFRTYVDSYYPPMNYYEP